MKMHKIMIILRKLIDKKTANGRICGIKAISFFRKGVCMFYNNCLLEKLGNLNQVFFFDFFFAAFLNRDG